MKGYTTAGVLLCELFFNVLLRDNPRFFPHLNPERRRTMVKINGKEAADVCGMTISQYLSANNYNPKHIVVELNEEILPKTEYDSTAIADGDVVEILSFMGGG
jgi:sulfur carrier protein